MQPGYVELLLTVKFWGILMSMSNSFFRRQRRATMDTDPVVSAEEQRKQQALTDYRKKLLQHRELEARVRSCE